MILVLFLAALLTACGSGGGGGSTTPTPTYTLTYDGNGGTGTVPIDTTNYQQGQTVTVLGNTGSLMETGYTFMGWNTQADGAGTTYIQSQTFTMGSANVTLYAKWTANADLLSIPINLVSSSHPDPNLWYNDGLGDWLISWNKPFPDVFGYYYILSTSPTGTPTAANGTFLQQEFYAVPAATLKPGPNYFHIVSVDPSSTVSTVDNVLQVQINTTPPTVASSSHPRQGTWYANNVVYLAWINPVADANFTGYYYILDHFADTVPTAVTGTSLPVTQKQLIIPGLSDGVWVFHLVNIDTQGATTKTAALYKLYIGSNPGTGNLSGTVVDGTGAPLGGVDISINRGLFGAVSNSNGSYTFNNNLIAGTWEVTASKLGYSPQITTITVNTSQATTHNFALIKQ